MNRSPKGQDRTGEMAEGVHTFIISKELIFAGEPVDLLTIPKGYSLVPVMGWKVQVDGSLLAQILVTKNPTK